MGISIASLEQAIHKCGGVQAEVARTLKISRQAVNKRVRKSARLQQAIRDAEEQLLDEAESQLRKAVRSGRAWAIRFLLQTKGKKRGYTQGSEIQIEGSVESVGRVVVLELPDNGRGPERNPSTP